MTFLIKNVQTSSQRRYVSRLPCLPESERLASGPHAKPGVAASSYLELQSASHVLLQRLSDGLIKIAQNLHRQLRVDARIADEVIESVCQSQADAAFVSPSYMERGRASVLPAISVQLVEGLVCVCHFERIYTL